LGWLKKEKRIMPRKLESRTTPIQNRARKQRQKILMITCNLLQTVGLSDLTTLIIAKKIGISVGTLYHYFPNKHAILFALSELWLEKMMLAIDCIESENIEELELKPFVNLTLDKLHEIYKANTYLMPIIPIMRATPELKPFYNSSLDHIHNGFMGVFERLSLSMSDKDSLGLAVLFFQLCESVLFNSGDHQLDEKNPLADLKYLLLVLLERERVRF
jgi:AcrR family transcriptional regulator